MNNIDDEFDWEFEESEVNQKLNKNLIPLLLSLMKEHKWDEAIEEISTFYLANQDQDLNDGLKNSCDLWLAMMFESKEEYVKALEINQRLANQINPDCDLFVARKTFVVDCLLKTGQYQTALKEIDQILDIQITNNPFDLLNLFYRYTDILEITQTEFSLKYSSFVEQITDSFALDFSHLDLANSDDLLKIVKEASSLHTKANMRYSKLILELPKIQTKISKIETLKSYIILISWRPNCARFPPKFPVPQLLLHLILLTYSEHLQAEE